MNMCSNSRSTLFSHRPNIAINNNRSPVNNIRYFQKKKPELPDCDEGIDAAFRGSKSGLSSGRLLKPFLFATGVRFSIN